MEQPNSLKTPFDHLLFFDPELIKFKYTRQNFQIDFLEIEVSDEKILYQTFFSNFHVESPSAYDYATMTTTPPCMRTTNIIFYKTYL